ncbi:MAG: dCTP deaminase [Paracoccaceae bacterium]
MTVLVDWQIRAHCQETQMVWPFSEELLNPVSIDVVLGNHLMIEVMDSKELIQIDISNRTEEDPYMLMPHEFCLAETMETFNLPSNISAQFVLKSSRAREGYENLLAGWCDAGWHGSKLTLELVNARRHWSLPLYPNLKIGQMVFFQHAAPLRDYSKTGRYNGDATVMGSKG